MCEESLATKEFMTIQAKIPNMALAAFYALCFVRIQNAGLSMLLLNEFRDVLWEFLQQTQKYLQCCFR